MATFLTPKHASLHALISLNQTPFTFINLNDYADDVYGKY